MVKRLVLLFAVTFLLCFDLFAQKIKYKDLFVLLNAKDYNVAEPFLRRFMLQDPDHPNANFNMALFYIFQLSKQDPLKDTDSYLAYSDSTILYYEKAHTLITDKEVKKNDDYYESYNRRDLRTGKYGVKAADIHFDIEKKIIKLKDTKEAVTNLKRYFVNVQSSYDSVISIYASFTTEFRDYQHFLFTSQLEELGDMERISIHFDDMNESFTKYKSELTSVPNSGYKQELTIERLEGFVEIPPGDFYADEVMVYDFKGWSGVTTGIIKEEIMPLKSNMEEYDLQLVGLFSQVQTEDKTVENELAALTEKMIFDQLRNYDQDPLPSNLFNFKVNEITYYSYINHNKEDGYLDSLNVDFQIFIYQDLQYQFKPVLTTFYKLQEQDLDLGVDFYSEFINARYGGREGFEKYISDKATELNQESERVSLILDSLFLRSMWAIHENDSIPMFIGDSLLSVSSAPAELNYRTLDIDTLRSSYWISGVQLGTESLSGFIAHVNFNYEVDTFFVNNFKIPLAPDSLFILESIIQSVNGGNEAIIFFAQGSDDIFCNVNYIDAGGLKWSKNVTPTTLFEGFVVDESQLILSFKAEEGSESAEEIRFDMEGNLIQGG